MQTDLNKKIAYVGCLGVVGIISTEFGIIGVLPQIAAHYDINIGTAGYLLSAFALFIAVTGPFTVLFASRFDKKTIMLCALGLFFISNFFSMFSPPFWLLMILRILPTVLHPAFFSMAIAAAVKGTSQNDQMKLTSIIIGGIALAQVTLIPLTTFLASIYAWQITYAIQGFIILVTIFIIFKFIPSMPNEQPVSFKNQLSILVQPRFISGTLLNLLLITAWFCSYSYFADYLAKEKHMSEKEISLLLLLFGAMGVFSNYLAGKFLGKYMFWTTLIFILGVFIVPLAFAYTGDTFFIVALVTSFWGIMYGPCFLIGVGYMISAAPNAKEFANSLQTSFGNLGVSLGTAIGGFFITQYSISITPWVGVVFAFLAIITIIWRAYLDRLHDKKSL
ncbi:MFS transporter [Leeuwenhoekiella marinoflava]|uniref:Predicted arabinose efflux permease, MFS family n=2 Tax=Leeuwenhoekiella marinoflava TaxID=988 RepID=A0ABY1HN75_9FLAO|nr:MFS transporter [Leeuwenhoekiella marinoflava]RXG32430.1 putative MFS family arabinose efflux permease [Leeuwenhoekiella marinoflava]SHE71993.1 Predicted arabinose efflux permease, MFS family [Leeuwenhoekiella marinoflava DSM 3653]